MVMDFNLVMLHKMEKIGSIRCLSAYKKCKDPNFVFQYLKFLVNSFGSCFWLVLVEKVTAI